MWGEVIATNNEFAKTKDKQFPYYETFDVLFVKTIAIGRRACHSWNPLQEESDSSNDDIIDMTKEANATPQHSGVPLDEGVQNIDLSEGSQSPPMNTLTSKT